MVSAYIEMRMVAWAKYAARGIDGGLGFKRAVSFLNYMPHGGVHDYTPDIDTECHEIDLCVNALAVERPELYAVVVMHYLRNDLKREQKLERLGICRKYYYARIDSAHGLVLGWLNDLACGITIPSKNNLNNLRKTA